jgi:hypothetical protein
LRKIFTHAGLLANSHKIEKFKNILKIKNLNAQMINWLGKEKQGFWREFPLPRPLDKNLN